MFKALGIAVFVLSCAGNGWTADALSLAKVQAAAGSTIEIPITLKDVSGTRLGSDASPIQALALRVAAEPAEAVRSMTMKRAGVTGRLQPQFEHSQKDDAGAMYLVSFSANKARIVLRLDPEDGGDEIGRIVVTLAPDLARGTVIRLSIDPDTATLSNEGGTLSEQTSDGTLQLMDGAIVIR
jgi:hypothetical protein